jgi:3-hydroxy acid dehydrogenase/malonic semialdehyde reductase
MNRSTSARIAVVTGASSGIGLSCARDLAKRGYSLYLGARRVNLLEVYSSELLSLGAPEVHFSFLDVQIQKSIEDFYSAYTKAFKLSPDVLINNAGLARGRDPVLTASIADWREMIDSNLTGLVLVTKIFLPSMVEAMRGDIVMIGSIAGDQSYEGGSVYCASKAAVTAFTDTLRLEVNGKNIRVIQVDPGMVETEFSLVRLRDQGAANKVYTGLKPLTGDDVAASIGFAISQPPHVCISKLVLLPTAQASVSKVHRG